MLASGLTAEMEVALSRVIDSRWGLIGNRDVGFTRRTDSMALLARTAVPMRVVTVAVVLSLLAVLTLSYAHGRESASLAPSGRSALTLSPRPASLPAAAQLPVSAALGAADPTYRVTASRGRFQALNPVQRFDVRFSHSGVSLSSGALHLGLSLRAFGEESSLGTVGDLSRRVEANRVTYSAPGLSEWYLNGPAGLEQGFTVASARRGDSPGLLTLAMALSGDTQARLIPGGLGVTFTHPGTPSLRYANLSATDASGATLHASFALHGRRLLLRIDTRGAGYPIRIDPLFEQGAELSAGEEDAAGGLTGFSVALSADGDTALIGAPREAGFTGAAWVFTRSGTTWAQQGNALTPSGESGAEPGDACHEEGQDETDECAFGASVALSADGDTALIGAPHENHRQGAAWVFTRSGSTWTPQGVELAGGEEETYRGHFGASVALSADGSTALIGTPGDRSGRGAAWVFTHSALGWTQQDSKLTAPDRDRDGHFGRSVALAADGGIALIGAPGDSRHLGAAWVFTRSGETWSQQGFKLTGGEEAGTGRFGFSTALSADGNTALIGGRSDDEGTGGAWVFTRSGENWDQQGGKLTGAGESGAAGFGYSVTLSADGNAALIGAPRDSRDLGAAWVFTRSGETWAQQGERRTAVGERGEGTFGASVALSANASIAIVGAPRNDRRLGAAWTLREVAPPPPAPPPAVTSVTPDDGPTLGATTVSITGTGFSQATAVSFGSSSAASFTVDSPTSLTAVSPAERQGTVDLTITTPAGTSEASSSDRFTFLSSPVGGERPPETQTSDTPGGSSAPGASTAGSVLAFGPTPASPTGTCTVVLHSGTIRVHKHARASLTLTRSGTGRCSGTLTLTVNVKIKGKRDRSSTRSIGAARFSIPPGTSELVDIELNRVGRVLLRSAHGHLRASLEILRLLPAPRQARIAAVQLAPAPSRIVAARSASDPPSSSPMGDTGLEPVTSALSRRRSPS